jgi:glutathione S-transferase
LKKISDALENIWLENAEEKPFLTAKHITFADILAACELEQPKMGNYDPFSNRPRLTKYEKILI